MVYEYPTGQCIRTSNWAQTLPPEQRPTFTQVASLAETAQQVNAVWKFALTHDDLPELQHFGKHVEHELGLECEWSWTIRFVLHAAARAKVNVQRNGLRRKAGRWKTSWRSAIVFNDISMLEAAGNRCWRWVRPMTR